jgi:NAD(P)-dependent dehydrogenase (short-subunit alcohol dehydrogenase family)
MDLGLTGRRALVTGASQGIGLAIAGALAQEGCDVTLVARRAAQLEAEAAALAARTGRKVTWVAADLTVRGDADTTVAAHLASHGGLDILVNNAGASASGDFFDLSDDAWETSFAVKFHGAVRMCRAAFPALKASGRGVIISNIGAAWKQPKPGFLIGASINAAFANFTKGLAQLGTEHGVRVVSMNSGPIRTEKLDATLRQTAEAAGREPEDLAAERAAALGMIRLGRPQDLADLACFLASDRAGHIHGSQVFIDGGQTREL